MDELAVVRWLGGHGAAPLDWLAWLLWLGGRFGGLWLLLALVGWAARRMKAAAVWQVILALILALVVVNVAAKPLADRSRPYELDAAVRVVGGRPLSSSFPSGHTASAFAAAVALSRGWPGGAGAWWTLAVLMALSRVYAGVHFPTDVAAGALIGYLCGCLVVGRTAWYSTNSASRASGVAR